MDMQKQVRVESEQYIYVTDGPFPDGIVYEDIMGELMKIFKLCYNASRG